MLLVVHIRTQRLDIHCSLTLCTLTVSHPLLSCCALHSGLTEGGAPGAPDSREEGLKREMEREKGK